MYAIAYKGAPLPTMVVNGAHEIRTIARLFAHLFVPLCAPIRTFAQNYKNGAKKVRKRVKNIDFEKIVIFTTKEK